jgi:hypothetical protein
MHMKAHGYHLDHDCRSQEQGLLDLNLSMGWELINLLRRQLPFFLLNSAALALMVALVLRDQIPSWWLTSWLGFMLTVAASSYEEA